MEQSLFKLPPEMWLISASQTFLKSGIQENNTICKDHYTEKQHGMESMKRHICNGIFCQIWYP